MAAPIVLLSGPPASGKTTVGRKLAQLTPGAAAFIEGDSFWFNFAKLPPGVSPGPDPQKMQVILKAMTAAATHYADAGYETIVDFSLGYWMLPAVLPLLEGRAKSYVVICPDKAICQARALTRKEGPADYEAVYGGFHDAFAAAGPLEKHIIRDALEPDAMALRIREGLDAGAFRLG